MPTIEIELTKTEVETLRRKLGIKTKTSPEVIVNSYLKLILKSRHTTQLIEDENFQYQISD